MKIFRKMLVTKWLLVPIDFHIIDFHYVMYLLHKGFEQHGSKLWHCLHFWVNSPFKLFCIYSTHQKVI